MLINLVTDPFKYAMFEQPGNNGEDKRNGSSDWVLPEPSCPVFRGNPNRLMTEHAAMLSARMAARRIRSSATFSRTARSDVIALTNAQLSEVLAAARSVPRAARGRYLRALAASLRP